MLTLALITSVLGSLGPQTRIWGSDENPGAFLEARAQLSAERTWEKTASTYDFAPGPRKQLDEETGLTYFGARYYDAKRARWISTDPEWLSQVEGGHIIAFNPYEYGAWNPLRIIDPDGRNDVEAYRMRFVRNVIEQRTGMPQSTRFDPERPPPLSTVSNGPEIDHDLAAANDAFWATADWAFTVTAQGGEMFGPFLATAKVASALSRTARTSADDLFPSKPQQSAAKSGTYSELRAEGAKDAHHVIQDAAVRDLPGYKRGNAPAVVLPGPSTRVGSPHYKATQVQRQAGGGTYAAERRIGYKAMRKGGLSPSEARQNIESADAYFQSLGVTASTPTRVPGNRRSLGD